MSQDPWRWPGSKIAAMVGLYGSVRVSLSENAADRLIGLVTLENDQFSAARAAHVLFRLSLPPPGVGHRTFFAPPFDQAKALSG